MPAPRLLKNLRWRFTWGQKEKPFLLIKRSIHYSRTPKKKRPPDSGGTATHLLRCARTPSPMCASPPGTITPTRVDLRNAKRRLNLRRRRLGGPGKIGFATRPTRVGNRSAPCL